MRYYWEGNYAFSMNLLETVAPWLLLVSVPYMLWLDRRMIEPRDGCWQFGSWLIAPGQPVDTKAIGHHLRAWAVKGFFTAFTQFIAPGNLSALVLGALLGENGRESDRARACAYGSVTETGVAIQKKKEKT